MPPDIYQLRTTAAEKYFQRAKELGGCTPLLNKLQKDYGLVTRVLNLSEAANSQAKISEITGIPKSSIRNWLRGRLPTGLSRASPAHISKIKYVKMTVTKRYKKKTALLDSDLGKLAKLQEDYRLVIQALDLLKENTIDDVTRILSVNKSTLLDWASGRKLPRSMRLHPAWKNKIDREALLQSLDFVYLLGAYQPRFTCIDRKCIDFRTKDGTLEHLVRRHIADLFGNVRSKRTLYGSKDLMAYIKELTDDNNSPPFSLLDSKTKINAYLQGVFDSRAAISHYTRYIKNSHVPRKRPVLFLHVTNDSLIEKMRALLANQGISASYTTDKRDGKRCLTIIEFASLRKCRQYLTHPLKKEKLSGLIKYASDVRKYDFNGKYGRRIQELKYEKEKSRDVDPSIPLRSSHPPRRVAKAF